MKRLIARTALMIAIFVLLAGYGSRLTSAQTQSNGNAGAIPSAQNNLPPDIHPDTLSRMPRAHRDQFATDDEKQAFDRVAALSATVTATQGVMGPTGTRAQIPELAESYRLMFGMLQKKCGVDQKYFEEAALVATRESNNEVEWNDHEANGIKFLGADVVELIRNKQDPKGIDEKEALIIQFGRELFRQPFNRVSSKTFAQMEQAFGRQGTLGITLVMGYYTMNALLMHAYDQHTDPARKRPFPDVAPAEKTGY